MSVPQSEIDRAREMIERAARPLFFHDDDCDGVSCYVMARQFNQDGKGVCVKQSPIVTASTYLRKIDEHQPDLIVIMDKPQIEEEFLEKVHVPVIWIDHHEPQTELARKHKVLYLNPRCYDDADNTPTSYWLYRITGKNLWIATVGTVGDWFAADFLDAFSKQYPGYLPETYEKVEDLYLGTRLGKLIQVLQFNLKGPISEVKRSLSALIRVEHPDEILEQSTPRGKLLYRKYRRLAAGYDAHIARAEKIGGSAGKILLYEYEGEQTYTSELSNELLIRYPDKITIVCRKHDSKRKCSLRSKGIEIPNRMTKALEGLDGRGGGHTNACGLVVADEDWQTFFERFSNDS